MHSQGQRGGREGFPSTFHIPALYPSTLHGARRLLPSGTSFLPSPSKGPDIDPESCEYEHISIPHSGLFVHSFNVH